MDALIHDVLASERGRAVLADIAAELTADLLMPDTASDEGLVELLVMRLAVRLARARPRFRADLLEELEGAAHDTTEF